MYDVQINALLKDLTRAGKSLDAAKLHLRAALAAPREQRSRHLAEALPFAHNAVEVTALATDQIARGADQNR